MGIATNKFKIVLNNMKQEEILNFIWMYDQYVQQINLIREEEEDWNMFTLNIEEFYNKVYKNDFK